MRPPGREASEDCPFSIRIVYHWRRCQHGTVRSQPPRHPNLSQPDRDAAVLGPELAPPFQILKICAILILAARGLAPAGRTLWEPASRLLPNGCCHDDRHPDCSQRPPPARHRPGPRDRSEPALDRRPPTTAARATLRDRLRCRQALGWPGRDARHDPRSCDRFVAQLAANLPFRSRICPAFARTRPPFAPRATPSAPPINCRPKVANRRAARPIPLPRGGPSLLQTARNLPLFPAGRPRRAPFPAQGRKRPTTRPGSRSDARPPRVRAAVTADFDPFQPEICLFCGASRPNDTAASPFGQYAPAPKRDASRSSRIVGTLACPASGTLFLNPIGMRLPSSRLQCASTDHGDSSGLSRQLPTVRRPIETKGG